MPIDNADDIVLSISADQATLRRSIQRIEQDIGRLAGGVQKQFAPVAKAIETSLNSPLQKRINETLGIAKSAAKEWNGALADQGKELERLRAQYNPLFATISRYKAAQAEIRTLYRSGTIAIDEYNAAMSRQRQEALASIAAFKARNTAIAASPVAGASIGDRGAQFRRQNLGYQLTDVGQTLALGAPIGMVAAQQLPQIAQIYAGQGGMKALLSDLGAISRIVGPAVAGITALYGAYKILESYSAEAALSVDDATKALADQASPAAALQSQIDDLAKVQDTYSEALAATAKAQDAATLSIVANSQKEFEAKKALLELELKRQEAVQSGQQSELAISQLHLRRDIAEQVNTRTDYVRQGYADPKINGGAPFVRLPDDVTGVEKTLEVINANPATDKIKEIRANATLTEIVVQKLRQGLELVFHAGEELAPGIPIPQDRPKNPYPAIDGDTDEKSQTSAKRAADAYRDLVKSADDRIQQLQLEASLVGKYGIAVDTARFRLDLLQQSEDKGRSLSADQQRQIEQKVALYGKMSDALARLKLQQDLTEDRRMSLLSPQDQQVAMKLKQYGLPTDDLNSPVAQSVRQSLQYTDIKDGVKSFLSDFRDGLVNNGGDIGEAFASSIKNAALNAMTKATNDLFEPLTGGSIHTLDFEMER